MYLFRRQEQSKSKNRKCCKRVCRLESIVASTAATSSALPQDTFRKLTAQSERNETRQGQIVRDVVY